MSGMEARAVPTELGFETMAVALPSARGVYTAEEFARLQPEKFALCVRALALGYKIDPIRRALEVAWETVRAVRDRKGSNIREHKKELMGLCFGIAERGLEELLQDDKRMARLDAVQIGILIDKGLLLGGEATSIVERREGLPALEALKAALAEAAAGGGPAGSPRAPGMGLEGEKGFALSDGARADLAPGRVIEAEVVYRELGATQDT
jgi:hypothetical protein